MLLGRMSDAGWRYVPCCDRCGKSLRCYKHFCHLSLSLRLQVMGQFHLGDFVNRIRPGSLVMKMPDSEVAKVPTMLFGTINGTIGVIASLPMEQYNLLLNLQEAMRKVVKGVGGLNHGEWRAFATPLMKTNADSNGFIDGDLIEQLLDLKPDSLEAVLAEMSPAPDADVILRLVEDLARLH